MDTKISIKKRELETLFLVGIKRQSSNFLKCIKTLVETVKDIEFQILMEKFSLFKKMQ